MRSPAALCAGVHEVVQALGAAGSAAGTAGVASLVTGVLLGPSLRRAGLGRAQASERSVPARQRYLRVARGLTRPWLSSAEATPHLIRAALAVVDDPAPHLALDTVRCGRWEGITVGVAWQGRVLPIAWEVLPYPWPKGAFTPAVIRLLRRISAAWPDGRRPHLVADRGFPSPALFRTLEQPGWGWTLRLRARLTVGVEGTPQPLHGLLAEARPGAWTGRPITDGTGRQRVAGHLVLGRGDAIPILPRHQANPGSARHRRRQQLARQQGARGKHPQRRSSSAEQTDGWLILFTSHADWPPASRSYTRRWSAEGSYRDAQGGYDGRHGRDLEDMLARESDPAVVDRVLGLWALGTLLQSWIGHHLGGTDVPDAVREVRAHWTTAGRLSVWTRGRFALTDLSDALRPWLLATLSDAAQRLRDAPPVTAPTPGHAA